VTVNKEILKPQSIGELRPGGLGLYFIYTIMDDVKYSPLKRGTRLIMKKRLGDGYGA